jgi:hypothetical protein
MGIEVSYRRLTKAEFERIRRDPDEHDEFVAPNLPGFDLEDLMNPAAFEGKGSEFLAALEKGREDPTRVEIDKEWQAIHFLLTSDPSLEPEHRPDDPLHNVVMGGHETEITTGYGPARILEPDEVRACSDALSKISVTELESRFNADELNQHDIYPCPSPGGWTKEEAGGIFEYYYPRLVKFFHEAAAAGEIVVIYAT